MSDVKIDVSDIKDATLNDTVNKLDESMNSVIKVVDDDVVSLNESVVSVIKVEDDENAEEND